MTRFNVYYENFFEPDKRILIGSFSSLRESLDFVKDVTPETLMTYVNILIKCEEDGE